MESHLSSDAWPAPWLAALAAVPRVCCVRGRRALSRALCAVPLVPGLPCLLVPWPLCCVGGLCAWCPGLLSCPVWVGSVCSVYRSALWAVWLGLIFRPCIMASLEGLLKKALIFALYFSGIFSLDFSPLYTGFYFFGFIFPALRSRIFFSGFFLRRNFRKIFSGFIFPNFFLPYFRGGIWLPLFSRCNIRKIRGSP